jgi:hypothetical protein
VEAELRAHGFRGYARVVLGDLGGLDEQQDALDSGHRLGFARSTAIGYCNLGSCLLVARGPRAAMEMFRRGMAFAETRGVRETAEFFRNLILDPLIELGEWDEALRLAPSVAEEARRRGGVYEEVYAESDRARVLVRREGATASEEAERVLVRAREIGDSPLLFVALLSAGGARLAAGDRAAAVAAARELLDVTQGDELGIRAADLAHPVELAVRAGDVDLAERMLEDLDAFPLPRHRHGLSHARAIVAEARGRPGEALTPYVEAAEGWAAFGLPYERALSLFGAARCFAATGHAEEATRRLGEAREVFTDLGARPLLAEVEASLASLERAPAAGRPPG